MLCNFVHLTRPCKDNRSKDPRAVRPRNETAYGFVLQVHFFIVFYE